MNFDRPYRKAQFFGIWAEETADDFGKRDALAVLDDVRMRCRDQDMRGEGTEAALAYLEARSCKPWPFQSFRAALDKLDPENRWQSVNAALNAIRRALYG